jgi:hypothetical protein
MTLHYVVYCGKAVAMEFSLECECYRAQRIFALKTFPFRL